MVRPFWHMMPFCVQPLGHEHELRLRFFERFFVHQDGGFEDEQGWVMVGW